MADKAQTPDTVTPDAENTAASHTHPGDTTILFGREFNLPLYTSVFIALGVLTVIEVLISGLEGDLVIAPLLVLAVSKASLVVFFYMHLKTDNRVFAAVLGVALTFALISVMFLLAVPSSGGY